MSDTLTRRAYPKSEFVATTPSGTPNLDIFRVEVAALALSLQPYQIYEAGTDVVMEWSDLPLAADITLINDAVANHPGGTFESSTQAATLETEDENDTGDEKVVVYLNTGKLPPGLYQLSWSMEVRLSATATNTGVEGSFYYTKNGGSRYKAGRTTNTLAQYISMGAAVRLQVEAGEEFLFELANNKIGAGAVSCFSDNSRIYLTPLSLD